MVLIFYHHFPTWHWPSLESGDWKPSSTYSALYAARIFLDIKKAGLTGYLQYMTSVGSPTSHMQFFVSYKNNEWDAGVFQFH